MKRLLLVWAFAVQPLHGQVKSPALDLLPPNGFLQAWERSDPARVFAAADLYGFIDGGAELYLEFGFEQLVVQRYRPRTPAAGNAGLRGQIQLEIYRMADPTAAAGIYLMNCGKESPDPAFRERHTVSPFQLRFKRDRCYVVINNLDGDKRNVPQMLEFGKYVASRLPADAPADALKALPQSNLVKDSQRLIRGPYALQAIYTLGEGDVLQLGRRVTAVAGTYETPGGRSTLIVADYPNAAAAAAAFAHLRRNLDTYLKVVDRSEKALVFQDFDKKYGRISCAGARLSITVRLPQKPSAN
jgi:hypothetical protein